MWGQAVDMSVRQVKTRIIPTRVGTRYADYLLRTAGKDHPHACGDKTSTAVHKHSLSGSSPRVWGQGGRVQGLLQAEGIIPTRVGTSLLYLLQKSSYRDHPHACGDKYFAIGGEVLGAGSSPRVWGQVFFFFKRSNKLRIIPTRVGTRLKKSRKIAVLQNQPLRFPLTFHRSFV